MIVGCPVRAREWILPQWADHILEAVARAGQEIQWAFVVPEADLATRAVIAGLPGDAFVVLTPEPVGEDIRQWHNVELYHHMTALRNSLLGVIREQAPDYFWSVDSDILMHPDSLTSALGLMSQFDAVGSKCYLGEVMTGRGDERRMGFVNFAQWHPGAGGLVRFDPGPGAQVRTEIIMAAKLMSPRAYAIDYSFHYQGEDVGYSLACKAAGLKLGWDGAVESRHVARRELLDTESI